MHSTLLADTERDSGGCNCTHARTPTQSTHTLTMTMLWGWPRMHFCFPTMHKVINYHTPDGEMST